MMVMGGFAIGVLELTGFQRRIALLPFTLNTIS